MGFPPRNGGSQPFRRFRRTAAIPIVSTVGGGSPQDSGGGVLLQDPGVLLKDPGVLLKDPGVLQKDPGVFKTPPRGL